MQQLRLEAIGESDHSYDYEFMIDGRRYLVVLAADVRGGILPVIFELDTAGGLVNERDLSPVGTVAEGLGRVLDALIGPGCPQPLTGVCAAPAGYMDVLAGATGGLSLN